MQRSSFELRLLLVCHAEGMVNRYSNLSTEDSGLTAAGWKQTDALAGWLKAHYKIDVLVSAPQLRNRLTAQRVGQAIGLPVTVHQGLPVSPQLLGDDQTGSAMKELLSTIREGDDREKEARSLDEDERFCRELHTVLAHLRRNYAQKTVAMFMGPATISAAMTCLFEAKNFCVDVDYTGVSELQLVEGRWHVVCINRRQHLPVPELARAEQPVPVGGVVVDPEDLSPLANVYNGVVAAAVNLEDEERHHRLRDLVRFAHLAPGMSVLDVGAGIGLLALKIAEAAAVEVVGIDISPSMLERAEYVRLGHPAEIARRVDFRLAAGQQLPFRTERFDVAICRLMLHLNRKPERILAEVWRVLKPGGRLVIADLLSADDPVKRATQNAIEERRNPAHVAARSVQQYRDMVTKAGFQIEGEEAVTFTRRLDDWLAEFPGETGSATVVREMIEASLETDAAGINARRQGDQILFDQRLVYVRAVKPSAGG